MRFFSCFFALKMLFLSIALAAAAQRAAAAFFDVAAGHILSERSEHQGGTKTAKTAAGQRPQARDGKNSSRCSGKKQTAVPQSATAESDAVFAYINRAGVISTHCPHHKYYTKTVYVNLPH